MNFIKKLSIRNQLLMLASITMLMIIVTFFITYTMVANEINRQNNIYMKDIFSQMKQAIFSKCDLYNRILASVAFNRDIQDYVMENDPLKKREYSQKIGNFMQNTVNMSSGIVDIIVSSDYINSYFMNGEKEDTKKAVNMFKNKQKLYYSQCLKMELSVNYPQYYFFVTMPVYSSTYNLSNGGRIGTAALVLDTRLIGLESMNITKETTTKYYLLDRDYKIFLTNDNQEAGQKFNLIKNVENCKSTSFIDYINGKICIIRIEDIPLIEGKLISIIPQKELLSKLTKIQHLVINILIFTVFLMSILFILTINNILKPIKKLMKLISVVKSGDLKGLKNRVHVEGCMEMSVFAKEFNEMLDEIDFLTHRLVNTTSSLYELELKKTHAELAFLQSQINPHFLYNTFDSIRGIAASKGITEIRDVTGALSQIFKYSIKGQDEVSLKEEFDIALSFIQIQKVRFIDRFEVSYEFSDEALECKVLKMILQPIIENAIFHGLELKVDKGRLHMSGMINSDDELVITVIDDGSGIDPGLLNDLTTALNDNKSEYAGSTKNNVTIGLVNVNSRLKLYYGNNYGISIESKPGKGTNVLIRIPARRI